MDPWTIPTAVGVQAYKHREEILSIWKRVSRYLRGEKAIIAVTGMPGTGKTVLLDHLTGRAKEDYRPPGKSLRVESRLRRTKGMHRLRILFEVIPGQETPIRIQGLDDLFNAKRPVAGL